MLQDVANNSLGSMSIGNPWEDRCLVIIECISSVRLRCQAVIVVVRRAKLPWTRALTHIVQSMLAECNDATL